MMSNKNEEEEEFKIWLRCSDGVSIDAKPFDKESIAVRDGYKYRHIDQLELESQSHIIYKLRDFCEKRAKIQNDPSANDEILVQEKLNAFNSEFRQHYQSDAIDFVIAACRLEIKSIVDLMMEDVADMFTRKTSEEIYDFFFINLKEYDHYKFELMVDLLHDYEWTSGQIM